MRPAIESMAADLARAATILLTELLSASLLTIELVELAARRTWKLASDAW